MIEGGDGAGLGQVGLGVVRAGDQVRVRNLDRDEAVQLLVEGQIDAPEAPLAQDTLDPIAADRPRRDAGLRSRTFSNLDRI